MDYSTTRNKVVDLTLKEGETPIILRVQRPNTIDLSYRLSRSMPLAIVLRDYCEKNCLLYSNVYFIYDGSKLRGDQTADQLEMESEDVIDVVKATDWGGESSTPWKLPKPMYIDLTQNVQETEDVLTIIPRKDMKRERLEHSKILRATLKKVHFQKSIAEAKIFDLMAKNSSLEAKLAIHNIPL